MKLYDHLVHTGANLPGKARQPEVGKEFAARRPVVVDISEVATYRWSGDPSAWSLDSYPNVAHPWPVAWYEFRSKGTDWGAACFSFRLASGFTYSNCQWFYRHATATCPAVMGSNSYWVDTEGALVQAEIDESVPTEVATFAEMLSIQEATGGKPVKFACALSLSREIPPHLFETMHKMVSGATETLFLALSFLHCKNVSLVDHATPPKVAAKRRKAGKPVGVTYKTLVIDGMKETLRTEGGVEKNGLKKALHICRGHFATYTADKPLFGKVVGTVWKPMHTRGAKERGEVRKDYKVVAGDH